MRVLSVLHPGGGHSGVLRDAAVTAGHELVEWNPGAGAPLPGALPDYDAVAVFGGGMNVVDQERLPFLTGEIELLRDAHAAGLEVFAWTFRPADARVKLAHLYPQPEKPPETSVSDH